MDITPDNTIIREISLDDLFSYLLLTGWKAIDSSGPKWVVYLGQQDAYGEPLEIVLPRHNAASLEARVHVASAVNLLSALSNEEPSRVVQRVRLYEYDILQIRDIETGKYHSIPLQLAARQVQAMKRLIAYATCSEEEPRTHFTNYQIKPARQMIEPFRFGQTFPGSFGFSVESKVVREPIRYIQKRLDLDPSRSGAVQEEDYEAVYLPIERRVMERIVRGLSIIQEGNGDDAVERLTEQYHSAFNANMCESIVEMSEDKSMPI